MSSFVRLQGTDGVRGIVLPSHHESIRTLSPQEAFLERGVITEQFVELYCYCVVRCMMDWGEMGPGREVIVGWDPRDERGELTGAALRGAARAGASVLAAGVLPTPAVPLFMLHRDASLSLVITASHNPADQNGIKIFLPYLALKPLPAEDDLISEAVFKTDYAAIEKLDSSEAEDVSAPAEALFKDFCCQERNSWLKDADALRALTLIVDPANGSYTDIAREVFERLGVGEVIEVNPSREGSVNRGSGVTQLEGNRYIGSDLVGSGGRDYSGNRTVAALFENGRRKRREMPVGKALVSAAVFDADGDRFYRVDYLPDDDRAVVLTGDEIAYLQAEYLMQNHHEGDESGLFVTTVESDINVLSSVGGLDLETAQTGVGDKWILKEIAERRLPAGSGAERRDPRSALSLTGPFKGRNARDEGRALYMGCEESGHNITGGWLEDKKGEAQRVFIGNGLKSAVNSYVATMSVWSRLSRREYFEHINEPFSRGFKKTYYVYHTDRKKLKRGSPVWNGLQSVLMKQVSSVLGGRCRVHKRRFVEDEDMLYLQAHREGHPAAAVFARNSGTEDKTGINLRGGMEDEEPLSDIGFEGAAYLAGEMKSDATPMGRASLQIMEMMFREGASREDELRSRFRELDVERLIDEMLNKEKLLCRRREGVLELSTLGGEICRSRFS